ncbi:hypothetical protein AMECASPLE_008463 [Ameca splendens]|uniref:Secreted protein n=1 Tax=Ameca splendens TaxID=208324 RepID=A0ABV0YB54_9TELE
MKQSRTRLFASSWSFISSILFARDLALERKTLGSDGRCGRFLSWTRTPARHPRFCFLSLCRLLLLPTGMSTHGEPRVQANSGVHNPQDVVHSTRSMSLSPDCCHC